MGYVGYSGYSTLGLCYATLLASGPTTGWRLDFRLAGRGGAGRDTFAAHVERKRAVVNNGEAVRVDAAYSTCTWMHKEAGTRGSWRARRGTRAALYL